MGCSYLEFRSIKWCPVDNLSCIVTDFDSRLETCVHADSLDSWQKGPRGATCPGPDHMAHLASLHRRMSALAAHRRRAVQSCRGTARSRAVGSAGEQCAATGPSWGCPLCSLLQAAAQVGSLSQVQEPHLVVHGVPPQGRLILLAQHCEHSQLAAAVRTKDDSQ